MRIDIATLFPEMVDGILSESIVGRARKKGAIEISCHQIRDYTLDKHRRVDDIPYGGGMGMVMQADPIYRCYLAVCEQTGVKPHTIYMTPKGRVFTQSRAAELSKLKNILIICGHYEGVDQRVIDRIVDEEISIGDYVLTGGKYRRQLLPTRLQGCAKTFYQVLNAMRMKAIFQVCLSIRNIPVPKYGREKRFFPCC